MLDNKFCYPHNVIGVPFTEAITQWPPSVISTAPIGRGYKVLQSGDPNRRSEKSTRPSMTSWCLAINLILQSVNRRWRKMLMTLKYVRVMGGICCLCVCRTGIIVVITVEQLLCLMRWRIFTYCKTLASIIFTVWDCRNVVWDMSLTFTQFFFFVLLLWKKHLTKCI